MNQNVGIKILKIKDSKYLKIYNQIRTVVLLKFRYLCLNHPRNNINVKLNDVMHGIDISMYGVAVMEHFNNLSLVYFHTLKDKNNGFYQKNNS